MDVVAALVAHAEAPVLLEVGEGPLYRPAKLPQGIVLSLASLADGGLDFQQPQFRAQTRRIVGPVGQKFGRIFPAEVAPKKDKERAYHHGVVQVRFRCIDGKGKAAGVCERMVLGPGLAPVSGIRAGFFPLPRPRGGRLSQQGRGANQSRRPCQAGRAAPCGDDPRRRPAANRGAAASRSCPSRSPSPAADPPRGFRS